MPLPLYHCRWRDADKTNQYPLDILIVYKSNSHVCYPYCFYALFHDFHVEINVHMLLCIYINFVCSYMRVEIKTTFGSTRMNRVVRIYRKAPNTPNWRLEFCGVIFGSHVGSTSSKFHINMNILASKLAGFDKTSHNATRSTPYCILVLLLISCRIRKLKSVCSWYIYDLLKTVVGQ